MTGLSVRDVLHKLLDVPTFDGRPGGDALFQVTFDGDTYYLVDDIFDPHGDGSVVAQLVPWPE